jgi:hypothetical protein
MILKNSGHCLENDAESPLEDKDTANILHLLWLVWNSNTQNPFGTIRMYRKGDMYRRTKMNRLLQLKNIFPLLMSLIRLLLVYDKKTHNTLMKDHRVVMINFMYM